MTGKPIHIIFALCLWLVMTAGAVSYYSWDWLLTEAPISKAQRIIDVEKGSSLYSVANRLHSKGIIRWPRVWVYYARFANLTEIKAGEYDFGQQTSPLGILNTLNEGRVVQYSVTFVEGMSFKDIIGVLHSKEKLQKRLDADNLDSSVSLLRERGVDITHPEGWFFPDTYQFVNGDTDISILISAHKKMTHLLAALWHQRDQNLPYTSAYEALIMASIIEKETGVGYEREKIAGVFVRRLEKNMRLQTDPTVIYGMGDDYKGNITRKDLRRRTPYNTYTIKGLPPTPIAMPGKAALYAALHPDKGNELYFVAKGDGSHQFSATLVEHEQAVKKYQLKRKDNYRSSPKAAN